jgi:hypothetical protein
MLRVVKVPPVAQVLGECGGGISGAMIGGWGAMNGGWCGGGG